MLREDKRFLDRFFVIGTGLIIFATYVALHWLMHSRTPPLRPLVDYAPMIAILAVIVTGTLSYRKLSAFGAPVPSLREYVIAYFFAAFGYSFIAYTFKLAHLSRLYMYGGLFTGCVLVAIWHGAVFSWRRGAGSSRRRRVLLVGSSSVVDYTAEIISGRPALGLEIAGFVKADNDVFSDVTHALNATIVDCVLFGADPRGSGRFEESVAFCQQRGIEVWFTSELLRRENAFLHLDHLEDMPVLVFSLLPRRGLWTSLKRVMDIFLSAIFLVLLSPFLLCIAVLICLNSPGPALFRQRRVGLNGREFVIFKFRSMMDRPIEAQLRNEMSGPVFKMREDPRTTPLGRWLRKYSIDELPQLWNVLIGDMSLVGPRPPLPSEVGQYQDWQRRRLSMRPGITGLWQVMGRNDLPDFNDWVKLDLRYLDGWSLWLDIKILLRTIPVVLKGTGH